MRTVIISVAATLLLVILSQSFAAHTLIVAKPEFGEQPETITAHNNFWGATFQAAVVSADKCATNQLDEVQVRRNPLQVAIGILTLGIWMPVDFTYRCGAPDSEPGDLE